MKILDVVHLFRCRRAINEQVSGDHTTTLYYISLFRGLYKIIHVSNNTFKSFCEWVWYHDVVLQKIYLVLFLLLNVFIHVLQCIGKLVFFLAIYGYYGQCSVAKHLKKCNITQTNWKLKNLNFSVPFRTF